ncbi:MAG TPA: hypothetical protein VMH41_16760 [Mycobacteriales bacterium]|nr:hypothetical protein [Mycobacteriales bacterium]
MSSPAELGVNEATLEAVKAALASGLTGAELQKATTTQGFSTTSGIVAYNLEAPAKNLYPVLTPLRNAIPRQGGGTGTAVNWKAITAINTTAIDPFVSEGSIGTVPSFTENDVSAAYRSLGYPNTITFEAIQAARGFDDPRALMSIQTLQTTMIGEEGAILGGNRTAIGKPSATGFTAADSTNSGPFTASTAYDFAVSALTLQGVLANSKGHVSADAVGETDGRTLTTYTTGSGKTAVKLTWGAVRGAVKYNVFIGAHSGTLYWAFSTGQTSIVIDNTVIASLPGSGGVANTGDQTANSLAFDGLVAQGQASANNGYWLDQAGATLTGDNAGGVKEIDVALQSQWDTNRLGPDVIWVNSQQAKDITAKVLANGSTTTMRVNLQAGADGTLQGGLYVDSYLNKFTQQAVPLRVHPNLPAGNVLMVANRLPGWFPNANVPSLWVMDVRQEYTQYDFAQTDRQYRIGVYVSEVLKGYFPATFSSIVGVGAG